MSSIKIKRLILPAFRDLPGGFVPFETIDRVAARLSIPVGQVAKLDANENVYGPSPAAVASLAKCGDWNLYPDASQEDARSALASYVGVDAKHILLFNGGDELIGMLCHLLVSPGDNIVESAPSFEMYGWYAHAYGAALRSTPRQEAADYAISLAAIRAATDKRTKLLLLCNPNNPTGTFTPVADILTLLDSGVVVMVDEAYVEFGGETAAPLVNRYENLVVLRTMSKWAGLAGLRVGYAVASAAIVEQLWKVKDPFNVNTAGQMATIASIQDSDFLMDNVRKIVLERNRLYSSLSQFPILRVYPSQANFLLCRVLQGSASDLRAHLERAGIVVRLFDKPALPNAIRITVGTPLHTDRIISAVAQWQPRP
jgi:histidinol-phosphate aminotransferase